MSAIDKTLDILFCVAQARRDVGVTEIADLCNSDKATVFRALKALERRNLIEQNPETRKYRLGLGTVSLAGHKLRGLSVAAQAQPFLTRLSQEIQETVQLSVRSGNHVLYLSVVESAHPIRVASDVGAFGPLHCTAAGKLFLAYGEPDLARFALAAPLEKHTEKTLTDVEALQRNLDLVRQRGWSLDDEELVPHLRVVAAPIRDMSGKVVAAVAGGGPTLRVTPEKIEPMAQAVTATAQKISNNLTGGQ
ncbi:MAG TPA: IclR family transcriptional regulator [Eoetvoesiella sp.]|uniref:IclR family transcriptional regulator n=1 Tax=Eoetvoesiella sp. TaxID=1966355 RepID=UPI002B68CF27|nr:IclR family transcriptional regulator [Eoetvoesiella sp.]HWK61581.1 IclR family transcriptional regulator [Eoetvoesiella sp.]